MGRYYRVREGEKMRPGNSVIKYRCCDCDLVHTMRFSVVDGEVVIEAWRDERSTAAARKGKSDRKPSDAG